MLDMDPTVATFLASANLVAPDCAPLMGQVGDPSTGALSCSYHKRGRTQYKPYLQDGGATITSPHKVYGPPNNDLAPQQRTKVPGAVLNHR